MTKKAYVGVNGKARRVKKIYAGADALERAGDLPAGYTRLEYIESTGTQYIDTGFQPNHTSRVVMDFEPTEQITGAAVYGAREWDTSQRKAFNCFLETETTIRSAYTGSFIDFTTTIVKRHQIDHNVRSVTLDGEQKTHQEKTFVVPCTLFLFCLSHVGEAQLFSKVRCYSCRLYDNGTIARDFVPCANAEGAAGLYDLVGKQFYGNLGTGTFTQGPANRPVAKRVKKGYIGVGGVARPFLGSGLEYYGKITSLRADGSGAAATLGKYAIFNCDTNVDAYNEALVRFSADGTNYHADYWTCGVKVGGNYVLFAGQLSRQHQVHAYNESLVKSFAPNLSKSRGYIAGASVGEYAIFAGGIGEYNVETDVDAYNSSLVKTGVTSLSTARECACGGSIGDYALFAGGCINEYSIKDPNNPNYV